VVNIGSDNVVGILTCCGLHSQGFDLRWGQGIFSFLEPIQTGSGAHTASSSGYWGHLPGVKQLGHGTDHPFHLPSRLGQSRDIPLPLVCAFVECYVRT
jgi:hypothetical protein